MCIVEQHPVPQMLYFYDEFRWGDGSPPLPFLYTLVILVRLYVISLLCLYSIIIFYLNRKKCTEGHLPCTNGIVLIQKAGMKRCGRLLPKLLQRQHNLRHKHPRLILSVNVPAIFFNHKIDPF